MRTEDPALLTGRGRFIDDADPVPGVSHVAIVRSPVPHARIAGFDAGAARVMPGVRAVVGPEELAEDLRPFPLSAPAPMPYRPSATDRVRFVGEPVAMVVAADRYVAEDAAERVHVEYEPLPTAVTIEEALAPDAPLLHDDAPSNVATDRRFRFGDPDEAFARAAHIVSAEYEFPRYSSTPIETYGVVAEYRHDGQGPAVTVWCNFHGPFVLQPLVAAALGLPPNRLRLVVPEDIGGSFGIKQGIYPYIALMAVASKRSGVPVRWTEDRNEHLLASNAGTERRISASAAVDDAGMLTALRLDLIDNVGAFLRPPEPSTLYRSYGNITGAYRIANVDVRARAVVTNTAPTGLNRGFGGQQLYFGLERLIDEIAHDLGESPVETRRRNFIPPDAFPYRSPTGGLYDSGDYGAALELALKRADYDRLRREQDDARAEGRLVGIGVATIVDPSGTNLGYVSLTTPADQRPPDRGKSGSTEIVTVAIDPFGNVSVVLGTTPQGQGHRTVARRVVADQLGLPPERVEVVVEMDTGTTPWTVSSGSYSSRFAPLTTSALVEACDRLATTLKAIAAPRLGIPAEGLELADGQIRSADDPTRTMPLRHAAGAAHWDPGALPPGVDPNLRAEASFAPPQSTHPEPDDTVNSSICYGFVADVVMVEVDPETLEVEIRSVTSVHDPGTVLDPVLLEGQTLGAMTHAIGGATLEELRYRPDGQPLTTSFMDYLCPTAAEVAFDVTLDHAETPSPFTRLGAKGSGEGNSMSMPVAIANAVTDALRPLGVTVDRLPVHGNTLAALLDAGTPGAGETATDGERT